MGRTSCGKGHGLVALKSGTDGEADSQRVEMAFAALREVQRAELDRLDERARAIEEKVLAMRSELSLCHYQVGDLTKRVDDLQENRLRLQVVGIVLATILAFVFLTAALLAIFKALGLLH